MDLYRGQETAEEGLITLTGVVVVLGGGAWRGARLHLPAELSSPAHQRAGRLGAGQHRR